MLSADLRIQPQDSEEWTHHVCPWIFCSISWRAVRLRKECCCRSVWEARRSKVQINRQSSASLITGMEYRDPLGIWMSGHSLSHHAKAPTHQIWVKLRDKLSPPAEAKYVSELVLRRGWKPSVVFLFSFLGPLHVFRVQSLAMLWLCGYSGQNFSIEKLTRGWIHNFVCLLTFPLTINLFWFFIPWHVSRSK